MYPNLYFFIQQVFGVEPFGFTKYLNTFGILVALAFFVAAYVLKKEFERKEKENLLQPLEESFVVGKPASVLDLVTNFIFGFIVGYKIIGIFLNSTNGNPQEYIFSSEGSLAGGIALAVLFTSLRYFEKKKQVLSKPETRKIKIWPHDRVGDITVYAAIFGFIGAKIFDNLENWDRFMTDPIGNLLSPSGLTFYGGLILASLFLLWYTHQKKITTRHFIDAVAPALMIAYAVGRMGCHFAGDGDWGIFNSAYKVNEKNQIVEAGSWEFHQVLMDNQEYAKMLVAEYGDLDKVPHKSFKGLSFLPNWFWAYNYPHNVNEQGIPIKGCEGQYCYQMSPPVFPTTLYEIIAGFILFFILWGLRKKLKAPGQLFGLYLMMNGMERFLVEKIRVNSTYDIFGFHPTQAEIISTVLFAVGVWVLTDAVKKYRLKTI